MPNFAYNQSKKTCQVLNKDYSPEQATDFLASFSLLATPVSQANKL